jgi:hypothetical protein
MKAIQFRPYFMRRLRNADHFSFYQLGVNYIEPKTLKPDALQPAWTAFRNAFGKEDVIYKRYLGRETTQLINASHKRRKDLCVWIKRVVKAALSSDMSEQKAAGSRLMFILNNYPDLLAASLTGTSAMITNMVEDMTRADHLPFVTTLELNEALSRLNAENEHFLQLYNQRAHSEGEEKEAGSLKDARKKTDQCFETLVYAINSFYYANEILPSKDPEVSAILGDIILQMNAIISKYEKLYAYHSPNDPGGKEDDNEPSPPDVPGIPDGPDEPDTPDTPDTPQAPDAPAFTVTNQAVRGDGYITNPYQENGPEMTLKIEDAQAFAAALYPAAQDGILRLLDPRPENAGSHTDYPIIAFLFQGGNTATSPIGLVVEQPDSHTYFLKPFRGDYTAVGEVWKNNLLLATLQGLQAPQSIDVSGSGGLEEA